MVALVSAVIDLTKDRDKLSAVRPLIEIAHIEIAHIEIGGSLDSKAANHSNHPYSAGVRCLFNGDFSSREDFDD